MIRIDPRTGKVLATIGLGEEPGGIAFGERSVWVTSRHAPTLFRIDPSVNEVVDRFSLPMDGVETDLTGEVAVGAGSVWVGHGAFNPGAWVERLDPATGRVQARFSILGGDVDHLAFGEGGLWAASTPSGELRKIDPRTNRVVLMRTLQSDLCCVAAGGGYVWAATNPSGDVWKLTRNGTRQRTIALSSAVEHLAYRDGALWATLGGSGAVVRIDPTTDAVRRYDVGHFVTGVDAGDGLVALGLRERRGRHRRSPGRRRLDRPEGRDALRQRRRDRSRVHAADVGRAADAVPLRNLRPAAQLPGHRGRRREDGSSPTSPRSCPASRTADARTRSRSGRGSGSRRRRPRR